MDLCFVLSPLPVKAWQGTAGEGDARHASEWEGAVIHMLKSNEREVIPPHTNMCIYTCISMYIISSPHTHTGTCAHMQINVCANANHMDSRSAAVHFVFIVSHML
jgi:hypothetical protein